jgi:hypothetical protein
MQGSFAADSIIGSYPPRKRGGGELLEMVQLLNACGNRDLLAWD